MIEHAKWQAFDPGAFLNPLRVALQELLTKQAAEQERAAREALNLVRAVAAMNQEAPHE